MNRIKRGSFGKKKKKNSSLITWAQINRILDAELAGKRPVLSVGGKLKKKSFSMY